MINKPTETLRECYDILDEKYKIDIQDSIDFKQLIDDVEREEEKKIKLLNQSLQMLESIKRQWNEKKLDDFFFELPYELNEFLCELKNEVIYNE
jgi:hypothetical protein